MNSQQALGIARSQEDVDAVLEKAHETTGLLSVSSPLAQYAQGAIDTYRWLIGETDQQPEV